MEFSKRSLLLIGVLLLTCFLPAVADCNPAGTWYGGSDFKYQATIIPISENRFTIIYDPAYSLTGYGFPIVTKYTGELIRRGDRLDTTFMGVLNMDSTSVPPLVENLHIWAIQQTGQFINCNTIQLIDVFAGGYFWTSNKVPLKDPPDYPLPATGLETYHRLPSPR